MTPTQMAVLLLRFFSIYLLFDASIVLTELPTLIFSTIDPKFHYMVTEHELAVFFILCRLALYLGLAIVFFVFGRPIGRFIAKGLEHD